MFNKQRQENLNFKENEIPSAHRFDDLRNPIPKCNGDEVDNESDSEIEEEQESVTKKNNKKVSIKENESDKQKVILPQERKEEILDSRRYCDLNEMEDNNHRLIRDVVVGRKYQQGDKQHKFDNDEIDNYFLQYQDFNDKVNYSSRNTCDAVDKIAQDRTHNTELVNKQGMTIGDFFDGLTRDEVQKFKQCKNPGCVIPSKYDNITQRQYYFDREGTAGTTYSNFTTRYETDGVNNGGKFYNDIEAHDSQLLDRLAL